MAHGVVHWEVAGRDLDRLASFYGELFGWQSAGFDADYRVVSTGGGIGGGLMRCRGDMTPYVTFYVAVDDLDEALARAKDLGGTPLVPPTPIPGVGSFAMFQDPEGNPIGILRAEGVRDASEDVDRRIAVLQEEVDRLRQAAMAAQKDPAE